MYAANELCQQTAEWQLGNTVAEKKGRAYLVTGLSIEEDPAELDNFGRVFRDVDSVFVAGGSNVDDHVAVQVAARRRIGSHLLCLPMFPSAERAVWIRAMELY